MISPQSVYRLRNSNDISKEILPTSTESTFCQSPHISKRILPAGESGRRGFHPLCFIRICWRSANRASRICNVLWPVVPAAIALRFVRPDLHSLIFILNYLAMVPCANLIGFTGQELSRKLRRVHGLLIETTIGSVVEVVMFMVLISHNEFPVIKAAILGSILATLLLCLGMCFIVGGFRHTDLEFSGVVGELGNGLLLTAGFALIIPSAFHVAVSSSGRVTLGETNEKVLQISRVTAGLLITAFGIYTFFQIQTHEIILCEIFEQDKNKHLASMKNDDKPKLSLTECIIGIITSVILVTIIAIVLVEEIPFIINENNLTDGFVGLILVPLIEKFAEHLTAIDEAWDNQMNVAISQVLGSTIQTALFNGPVTVLVGWIMGKNMDLNFEMFNVIFLILAILVVGNFLRDHKSNYLEGWLIVIVYINIAATVYYYPDNHNIH